MEILTKIILTTILISYAQYYLHKRGIINKTLMFIGCMSIISLFVQIMVGIWML